MDKKFIDSENFNLLISFIEETIKRQYEIDINSRITKLQALIEAKELIENYASASKPSIQWIEATQKNYKKYSLEEGIRDDLVYLLRTESLSKYHIIHGNDYWINLNQKVDEETGHIYLMYNQDPDMMVTHFADASEYEKLLPIIKD